MRLLGPRAKALPQHHPADQRKDADMAEETKTMKSGDDPKDFNVDQVKAYLETADDAERERVLQAERDGKGRAGIVGTDEDPEADQGAAGEGLAGTGNKWDMAEPYAPVATTIGHQPGTPPDLAQAADEAAAQGFIGTPNPNKPDGSQRNPAVMNQAPEDSEE